MDGASFSFVFVFIFQRLSASFRLGIMPGPRMLPWAGLESNYTFLFLFPFRRAPTVGFLHRRPPSSAAIAGTAILSIPEHVSSALSRSSTVR